MWHAIAFQAIAFFAFVLSFGLFYLTGLLLQGPNKSEGSKAGQVLLVLLSMGSMGCFGTMVLLADRF